MTIVKCACGCETEMEDKDKYGRVRRFISGHNNRKYDEPTEYKKVWWDKAKKDPTYIKKRQKDKQRRNREKRAKAIDESGGCCSSCGLKHTGSNSYLFDFHHVDPTLKLFNLGVNAWNKYSFSRIAKELKKCIVFCSNCHREYHHGY